MIHKSFDRKGGAAIKKNLNAVIVSTWLTR